VFLARVTGTGSFQRPDVRQAGQEAAEQAWDLHNTEIQRCDRT